MYVHIVYSIRGSLGIYIYYTYITNLNSFASDFTTFMGITPWIIIDTIYMDTFSCSSCRRSSASCFTARGRQQSNSERYNRNVFMASQPTSPTYPPQKYGLIKGLSTIGFPSKALLSPYFWGGYVRGGLVDQPWCLSNGLKAYGVS